MALKIDKAQLQIEILQDTAMQNLKNLETQIRTAKTEMNKLKQGTDEYRRAQEKVKQLENTYQELASKIDVADMTLSMLTKRQRELNAALREMRPNSASYQKYSDELNAVNNRMRELRGQATSTSTSLSNVAASSNSYFSRLAGGMNKYAVMASGFIAGITGITLTAKKCVDAYAEMEEAESQVVKYTGMTKKEVEDLNEDFKKMDTRTARQKLNELAGDAGKLGLIGKKSIEDFVSAGDIINVALGDELGQDAVKNIGKLALMFGEDKTKGLRGAMLATGSAINQLSQSSSSDAGYLVDFTARVAGAAHQANLSQANIIGFASVLDENMQQVEMAGTAFQTLLLKMYQDPAKFAKLAGKNVKEFTHLLKTDANEAVIQFLQSLKGQGGLDKLAPMFQQMGLDGVRASGVLATLAGKITDVRREQKIANQAYQEGTSVITEFDIQNKTVQAGFDKAKKDLNDEAIDLGKRLKPAMTGVLSTTRVSIRVLSSLTSFLLENKRVITLTVATIVTYITICKLQELWVNKVKNAHIGYKIAATAVEAITRTLSATQALCAATFRFLAGDIKGAKEELAIFNAVTKMNPIAFLVTALVAAAGALYLFATRTTAAGEAQKAMIDLQNEAIGNIENEITKTRILFNVARDETKSKKERMQAIQQLNKISPEYLGKLDLETIKTNNAKRAVDSYIHSLIRQAEVKAEVDRLGEINKNLVSNGGINGWLNKNRSGFLGTLKGTWSLITHGSNNFELEEMLEEKKKLEADINKRSAEVVAQMAKEQQATTSGGGLLPKKQKKGKKANPETPYNIDTKNLESNHTEELNKIKKNALDNNQTEAEYNLANIEENRNFYEKKYALTQKYLQKTKDKKMKSDLAKDEQNTLSQLIDIDKQMGDARLKVVQEQRDRKLDLLEENAEESKQQLAHQYADGIIREGEYNIKVSAIDENVQTGRLAVLSEYHEKVKNVEMKDGQAKLKAVKEANMAVLKADQDTCTARAKTEQTLKDTIKNFKKQEGIKNTTEEDYQERLDEIQKFYDEQIALLNQYNIDTTKLKDAKSKADEQAKEDYQKAILDIKEQFGIDTTKERHDLELKELEDFHNQGLMSEKEYNDAKKKLDKKYNDGKKLDFEKTMKFIQELAGNVSSAVQGFAEAETITSDAKYDKQITAAKKAGKDTTKLEEQKEAAQNKIKKKYADIQFAAAVLQIGSTTAVTAMEAYKALAGITGVGPVLGAAAAAAAVLAGAAQIKVAKANRDAAKGLYTGGFSNDYVEGYTGTGNSHDVAGAIPVHKNEWVANHEAVANPHVRKFLDVFNIAQRNGTINMLDTTAILQQLQLTGGRYSGGYTDTPSGTVTTQHISVNADYAQLTNDMQEVKKLLAVIAGKKITLAMTDVRDKLNELNTYESNASR
jgi:TP901 family phage tail tape measure protein